MASSIPSSDAEHRPRVDVVMQVTGRHAHAASQGIVNALSRMEMLGSVFRPEAAWGQSEPGDDDGLFEYMAAPRHEFMLFLGFDWHSQALHTTPRWRHRIRTSPCVKVGYLHETLRNGSDDERREKIRALLSCHSLVNVIWHASPSEADYVETLIDRSRPVVASDFAVDTGFFECHRPPTNRKGFAFFRGKLLPFTHPSQYEERREIVSYLEGLGLVEVKNYDPSGFSDESLVEEYNGYRFCIDPPSVFDGPTTRVFEAIACGCIVFSHARNFGEDDVRSLSPLLRTFTSKHDLAEQLQALRDEPSVADFGAERLQQVRAAVSLDAQMASMVTHWCRLLPEISLSAPIVRIFDHPYHAITKSQQFLFEYFSDLNSITVTCDTENRAAMVYDSPTFDWGCYMELAWQTVHIFPHFERPTGYKRFLFPMFDGSNHWPDDAFPAAAHYVCFSRALHERMVRLGRESTCVHYFPRPERDLATLASAIERTARRQSEGRLKAYFWQRTSEITLRSAIAICRQIGCTDLVVNVHGDPGQVGLDPVEDGVVDGVRVRTHGWFPTRVDALALVDDCDVYIASRSCEGIGMGFLEAMSRGLCVVAYDAPTMNEYIVDGVNGVLYRDIRQPRLAPAVDVAAIRRCVVGDIEPLHRTWATQFESLIEQCHPYKYSSALRFLRGHGVAFFKHFDFSIPIDRPEA